MRRKKTSEAASGNMDLGKDTMASNTGSYQNKTDLLPWNPCQEHGTSWHPCEDHG